MSARFVLLHSPLLGPISWLGVAEELRRRGQSAEAPPWLRLSDIGGAYYPALAGAMAAGLAQRPEPVILVAHSGAGALIPELARMAPGKVVGVIFADAILPHPGRSWFDTAPPEMAERLRAGAQMGDLPRWADWWPPGALQKLVPDAHQLSSLTDELEALPVAYFDEPAPSAVWSGATAYLQLSGAYDLESQVAARSGWPLVRLSLHHLAMLTDQEIVATALGSLSERLVTAHG